MICVLSVVFAMCRFMPNNIRQSVYASVFLIVLPNIFYPGVPRITLEEIVPDSPFIIGNPEGNKVEVTPLRVMHGKLPILGYRIGRMAWITDMLTMPGAEYDLLQGLDVLVMNALRPQPHHTHQNLKEALDNAQRIGAGETYFIHMSHHIGLHADAERLLPPHVHFAYDGMKICL